MRDVDAWGVVWYGNYLAFCDEARAELLRAFGLAPGTFFEQGFLAPVVEMGANYHAPARYDEEIDVHVRVSTPRGTRLHFEFSIVRVRDGAALASIETTLVLVRTNGDLVYLIPEEIKSSIGRMVAAQPEKAPERHSRRRRGAALARSRKAGAL